MTRQMHCENFSKIFKLLDTRLENDLNESAKLFFEMQNQSARETVYCILKSTKDIELLYYRLLRITQAFSFFIRNYSAEKNKGIKKNDLKEMLLYNELQGVFHPIHCGKVPFPLWEDLAKDFIELVKLMSDKKNFYYYNYPEYDDLLNKINKREIEVCKEYPNVFANHYGFT